MRFSRHFGIGLTQPELDFVDVDLDTDTPLFLDPYTISVRPDDWAQTCATSITIFFDTLLDAVRRDDDDRARELLGSLHEPNETRLGLSSAQPQGNAIGDKLASDMLRSLKQSRAVQTGLLRDLSDSELFVEGIGHDRVSDLVTNIVRDALIEYTHQQCHLHGVAMRGTVASGPMWDSAALSWRDDMVPLPIVDGRKVLLVPKAIVRWTPLVTPRDYYDNFVLNFLQQQELRTNARGLTRRLKNGDRRVYKSDLKEEYPLSKAFLRTFSEQYPDVLQAYKEVKAERGANPDDVSGGTFDEPAFAQALVRALAAIPAGSDDASRYHRLMIGLLEFVFFPQLLYPKKEAEINEGRKRIDIVYTNGAKSGLFERFTRTTRRASMRIMVECKNYSTDPANPEVDQIAGRFADNRGWLGLLVFRTADNLEAVIARCRDMARAGHGYVVPLRDLDLVEMLGWIATGGRDTIDGILDRRFVELTR